MNRVTLMGNVGKDPEVRSTANNRVANLSLATSDRWTDKETGERKERVEWHRLVAWGPLVDVIEKYVKKGSKILVEGSLQTRKWVDQAGAERYTTEIRIDHMEFAGNADRNEREDEGEPPARSRGRAPARATTAVARKPVAERQLDDDIPF